MGYRLDGLQAAREGASLTVARLAVLANVSEFTIRRLEDNTRPSTAEKLPFTVGPVEALRLADALGTDLDGLTARDISAS